VRRGRRGSAAAPPIDLWRNTRAAEAATTGGRTLEQRLPTVEDSHRAVVVLRLRGRETLGTTLIDVLARYARAIQRAGGRVHLSSIREHAYEQLVRTGKLRLDGPVRVDEATPVLGESTRDALVDAEAWLINADGGSNG
jgi:SulP family sulfate permease